MLLKVDPHPDYPPEEGCYIRGNDRSPVVVCIILKWDQDKVPPEIEALVRAGAESGAALSGTLQTENIGLEKIVCNVVANPNIRYFILGGPESEGHLTGDAVKALLANGVDEKGHILGTDSPHPYLYNIPPELIERFRKQVNLVDLQFQGDPGLIRQAVWSCYQEEPVDFRGQTLYDTGAYPEPALSGKITWKVMQPWGEPTSDAERAAQKRAFELMDLIRKRKKKEPGE
ncbi:MAG: tetrahydromethanopterin S-methyltransferase subunit A [Actinobacteria bacterium]|jgi:tetrahydromethanopterin S-methyltransferase subunit A|nr:MAG: tetrahydromethanopterin S-methyltransferase subunit A [Actinomycetota bacterium]